MLSLSHNVNLSLSPPPIFKIINCSVFILLLQFHLLVNFLWQFQLLVHDLQPLSLLYSPYIHFTLFIGCKGNNNNNNNNNSNNNLQDLQPLDVCGMGRAGSVAKLMACAYQMTVWFALHRKMRLLRYLIIASNILHFSTETRVSVKK